MILHLLGSRGVPTFLFGMMALLAGTAAGCSTTQEKAERAQARATHILEARAERQQRKHGKSKQGQPQKGSEQ